MFTIKALNDIFSTCTLFLYFLKRSAVTNSSVIFIGPLVYKCAVEEGVHDCNTA